MEGWTSLWCELQDTVWAKKAGFVSLTLSRSSPAHCARLPSHRWGLPEEDQVLLLLTAPKEMDQLVEFLICLTYLHGGRASYVCKNKVIPKAGFRFSLHPTLTPLFLQTRPLTQPRLVSNPCSRG